MRRKRRPLTYRSAGVDLRRYERLIRDVLKLIRRTHRGRVVGDPGGFAGVIRADGLRRMREPLLVACADGVGTKLKIAQTIGRHDTIGIDLVAMNVNDLICTGARPLFFLDMLVSRRLDPRVTRAVLRGIVRGCEQAGCVLLGGETAEHPGMGAEGEYDLSGFAVGIVDRSRRLEPRSVRADDRVIGLASNGVHSNGFSLIRKILREKRISLQRRLNGRTLAEELLRPTRIYVRPILDLLGRRRRGTVRVLAHVTGGGLGGNLQRVLPPGFGARIHRGSWPVPPIFCHLQRWGGVSDAEMRRVFNMGIGMAAVVAPRAAPGVLKEFRRTGIRAWEIGRIVRGNNVVEFVDKE